MNLLQGYNGSQLWDTAFAVQAIVSTNLAEEYGPTLKKAHSYIKKSQVDLYFSCFRFAYPIRVSVLSFQWVYPLLYSFASLIFGWKVLDDCPGNLDFWYRHISKGAWPFSTADHGWPISDCTAEGLKVLMDQTHYVPFVHFFLITNIWILF